MSTPIGDAPCVAVLDIGKTNKKVHIYDSELNLIDSLSENFEPVLWQDVPVEPSQAIQEWMLDALSQLASRHTIRVISVATHGAAFACLDDTGELAVPVIDYTYEPGDTFHEEYYQAMGSRDQLQVETATLELKALINPGKALYFLKTRFPDEFSRVRSILFYPQYFGYQLTRTAAAEHTYVGCHTYLFDFANRDYGRVADELGIREHLPSPIRSPGEVLGRLDPQVAARTGLSPLTVVTVGVHDSNASLLPYLIKRRGEDLIVNSTGTWCVAMHPESQVTFRDDEIGKAVFYNMSPLADPVKTSILMGGLEYETYTDLLAEKGGYSETPAFDPGLYQSIIDDSSQFLLPTVVPGTGQFPDSTGRVVDGSDVSMLRQLQEGSRECALFKDPERFYGVLNLSLAVQTMVALQRVGLADGTTVFTEGGFRNNDAYSVLLATLVPQARFVLSGMPEATSFGAALLGTAVLEECSVESLSSRFTLTEETVTGLSLPGIDTYAEKLINLCQE